MRIRFGDRTVTLPASRLARMAIGVVLILGGLLGFLPIFGFWMIPLGLIVLSVDIPMVRRRRRQLLVWLGPRLRSRFPVLADKLGFRNGGLSGSKPYRIRRSGAAGN